MVKVKEKKSPPQAHCNLWVGQLIKKKKKKKKKKTWLTIQADGSTAPDQVFSN